MTPIVNHKLDLFKGLLGADEHQVVDEEQKKERMTEVKMDRDELRSLMREAMAASREDALTYQPKPSAQGGANDETGDINALSVKLSNFWTEDPESWFDRADCLLYTSPSPRDLSTSRMPSSA